MGRLKTPWPHLHVLLTVLEKKGMALHVGWESFGPIRLLDPNVSPHPSAELLVTHSASGSTSGWAPFWP